jgi:hypothetical protein
MRNATIEHARTRGYSAEFQVAVSNVCRRVPVTSVARGSNRIANDLATVLCLPLSRFLGRPGIHELILTETVRVRTHGIFRY